MTDQPDTGYSQFTGASGDSSPPDAPEIADAFPLKSSQETSELPPAQAGRTNVSQDAPYTHGSLSPRVVQPPAYLASSSLVLQEWEGVVESVTSEGFRARLRDLTHGDPDRWSNFRMVEVSDDDLHLVTPGAVFYWLVSRRINEAQRKSSEASVFFRRLPGPTSRDILRASKSAAALAEKLGID